MGILDTLKKLHTPEQVFTWKLGAALSMERTVLETIGDLQEATPREEIRRLLTRHESETREQISRIEQTFHLLEEEVDDSPCPAIQGLSKEGAANLKKVDDAIIDTVVLSSIIETEHHEIAVYEVLVANAEARGREDIAQLLTQSLQEEQAMLDETKQLAERVAKQEGYAVAT